MFNSGHSRIPIPKSAVKREANVAGLNGNYSELISPSNRSRGRAVGDSPAKFLKPSPATTPAAQYCSSPRSTIEQSPLGTPYRRVANSQSKNNHRLSMYGVPLAMTGQSKNQHSRHTMIGTKTSDGCKRIVVCIRKRPLSRMEQAKGAGDCVEVDNKESKVSISVVRTKLDGINKYKEDFSFGFDKVYDEHGSNMQIYRKIVDPLISFALKGGKATCFAYGQTGSGKTHTMFHPSDGQCYLAISDLLDRKEKMIDCFISFFEIYQGQLYDLLKEKKRVVPCEQHNGQVKIMGLSEDLVTSEMEAREAIDKGLHARMTGKTGANSQSSRSHAILQFTLKSNTNHELVYGRVSFIDLAGSERGADRAEVDQKTKMEGSEINKSLLALKECIRAIDLDSSHLPFRQSKLTLVLKDSIVGEVRTAMIATVSPSVGSSEHSLNTLRYAERFYEISGPSNRPWAGQENDSVTNENRPVEWTVSPMPLAPSKSHSLSAKATPPIKSVTFGSCTPDTSRVEERRNLVYSQLNSIRTQVDQCHDEDVLELLQEELSNINHAFRSLA